MVAAGARRQNTTARPDATGTETARAKVNMTDGLSQVSRATSNQSDSKDQHREAPQPRPDQMSSSPERRNKKTPANRSCRTDRMELNEIERTKPRPSLQETAKAMSVMAAAEEPPWDTFAVVSRSLNTF